MPALTKQNYEALTEKELNLLLRVISTDNILRGMPSFQEWCASVATKKHEFWLSALWRKIVSFIHRVVKHV